MQTLRKQDGGQTKCKSRKRQNLKCDFYAPLKVQVFYQKSEREREKHFFKLKRQKIKFNKTFFKKWAIPVLLFFIFVFSTRLTVNKCSIKVCQRLDLNRGSPVSEVTGLPLSYNHCPIKQNFNPNFLFVT